MPERKNDLPVEDLAKAERLLAEIGKTERAIESINLTLNAAVEQLKGVAAIKSHLYQEKLDLLLRQLFEFAEKNRKALTHDKKVVKICSGEFGWRLSGRSVEIPKTKERAVIKSFQKLKLSKYLQVTYKIAKGAILKDPKQALAVDGVTIAQHEIFFAKPSTLKTAITRRVEYFKKRLKKNAK